jgi:DNA mismatch repair protein MSH5
VQDIAKDIESSNLESINTVYFPQLGFLITIPIGNRDPAAVTEQLGFELQFLSDKIAYFKNQRMRGNIGCTNSPSSLLTSSLDLDEDIGDIYADIIDCQLEIMQQLCGSVFALEGLLVRAVSVCSEIDW